jgi:hypothetical protein
MYYLVLVQTCNIDKQVCESDFQRCLKKLCNSVYRRNPQCSQAADLYVMGTSMFGGSCSHHIALQVVSIIDLFCIVVVLLCICRW